VLSCTRIKDTESKISYKASENESFADENAILIASEIGVITVSVHQKR
jgi:hypothetical protein